MLASCLSCLLSFCSCWATFFLVLCRCFEVLPDRALAHSSAYYSPTRLYCYLSREPYGTIPGTPDIEGTVSQSVAVAHDEGRHRTTGPATRTRTAAMHRSTSRCSLDTASVAYIFMPNIQPSTFRVTSPFIHGGKHWTRFRLCTVLLHRTSSRNDKSFRSALLTCLGLEGIEPLHFTSCSKLRVLSVWNSTNNILTQNYVPSIASTE